MEDHFLSAPTFDNSFLSDVSRGVPAPQYQVESCFSILLHVHPLSTGDNQSNSNANIGTSTKQSKLVDAHYYFSFMEIGVTQ